MTDKVISIIHWSFLENRIVFFIIILSIVVFTYKTAQIQCVSDGSMFLLGIVFSVAILSMIVILNFSISSMKKEYFGDRTELLLLKYYKENQ